MMLTCSKCAGEIIEGEFVKIVAIDPEETLYVHDACSAHISEHPGAGSTYRLEPFAAARDVVHGAEFVVVDWVERLSPDSSLRKLAADGNWAARHYLDRNGDDPTIWLVYGKIKGLGAIVHVVEMVG